MAVRKEIFVKESTRMGADRLFTTEPRRAQRNTFSLWREVPPKKKVLPFQTKAC